MIHRQLVQNVPDSRGLFNSTFPFSFNSHCYDETFRFTASDRSYATVSGNCVFNQIVGARLVVGGEESTVHRPPTTDAGDGPVLEPKSAPAASQANLPVVADKLCLEFEPFRLKRGIKTGHLFRVILISSPWQRASK